MWIRRKCNTGNLYKNIDVKGFGEYGLFYSESKIGKKKGICIKGYMGYMEEYRSLFYMHF